MKVNESLINLLHTDVMRLGLFVSTKKQIIYVSTPKVACTSLLWWLAEIEGYSEDDFKSVDSCEVSMDLKIHDCILKIAPHLQNFSPDEIATILTSGNFFSFCIVRNPYTRIFSAWQSKILLEEPLQIQEYKKCNFLNLPINNVKDIAYAFENFLSYIYNNEFPDINNFHWKPMVELLYPDIIPYTKIYRLERCSQMAMDFQEIVGCNTSIPLSKKNKFNDSILPFNHAFFTSKSIELIKLLYKDDFTTFDYSADMPKESINFTKKQFDVYIRAIYMLRSRHKRIGEILSNK